MTNTSSARCAIDKLRHLMIMKEGIQLPSIVVVGDQSSGKSGVLESLAGIIAFLEAKGYAPEFRLVMGLQNIIISSIAVLYI